MAQVRARFGITSESISLADFMTNWLNNIVALNVKPTSMQTYRYLFKNHVAPYLGEVKVHELTPAMLDEWLRKLLRAGLSRNVLLSTRAFLCHALNYAVYEKQFGDSCVAIYREEPLPSLVSEKVLLVCTCNDGQPVARWTVMRILRAFGLNSHSFRYTHTADESANYSLALKVT